MDILKVIEQFEEFKNSLGISRDKAIEIYNYFKLNPEASEYCLFYNSSKMPIRNESFWHYLNTSIIKELYSNKYKETGILETIKPQKIVTTDDLIADLSQERQDKIEDLVDKETSKEYTKLRKEAVTYKTKLNHERNMFNKKLKEISELEELNRELIKGLRNLKPIVVNDTKNNLNNIYSEDVLIAHIGDWHLGEIAQEFKDTGFDMEIASKRIKKYAEYIKQEVVSKNIKKVVIMCGGDICNNVTLLSKRLLQTSNRAVTTIMAVVLLQNFILDIYTVCNNIVFAGVGSNEARYDEDYFEDEYLITNCADYVVYNILEILFKDIKTINFLHGRNNEKIINVNNNNFLLTHGVGFGKGDLEKSVQQAIARYSVKNIDIRYVLLSHIHCARNSSYFSRNGSLVGSNAYSNSTLNLQSRASQNLLYVSKNGDISSVAVDLENVSDITGYDISYEIEKFELKSRSKNEKLDIVYTV